ncbi:hypothetical protein A3A75_03075 [Candidatus Woesebacteria bacterium RIFCSPLOWO2_01_FULL_39_10]|uniref:DUF86 domain-containing protein n=1 Tax=Candidatus Woesebacteria bacterium RIFCSPLOWO2_01_FULL_39_10 TaxID=1802516 RepID=A0A1F8B6Y6_9BACT|nr:MAG: hypothetical protein A3A75_03075 [Candidatus Woesebacteria bacterium RIFCSPLOWO2_01_FULL_39_10]
MSPLDKQLVTRKAKLITGDLEKLKRFEKTPLSNYLRNPDTQLLVERLLEKITSRLIEINYHILRQEFGTLPKDYFNSFEEMGKVGVISKELAEQIAPSAGLRNALAHEYDTIDQSQVYYSMKRALDQIPQYLQLIIEYLG